MSPRTLARLLSAGLLVVGVVAGSAGPAAAHANLVGTEPGYGTVVAPDTRRVLIRYDLPVEVKGAQISLERSGRPLKVGRPTYASPDHKDVSVPLPPLAPGSHVLTWFLFGSDGDVMGAELAFSVPSAAGSAPTTAPSPSNAEAGPPPAGQRAFAPLARAQDAARLMASASLVVLVGGVAFVALLWPAGARLRRTRVLLWVALGGALVANAGALGLKGAAVQGQSALAAFSPAALSALNGTHVGRVLLARLGFLLLAVPLTVFLTRAPDRAVRSHRWYFGMAVSSLGALVTHGLLSHGYARGGLASVANVVHLGAVAVWLGGLAVLALVVLPRRRADELSFLVPWFSRLAFVSVATAVVAGIALLLLISPRWSALPGSGYGRFLLLKLALVVVLLAAASRARGFVRKRLPGVTTDGAVGLQPFVTAVTAEVCIAASILSATAILVGRPPPA
ncbi:MAG: copper resistance CopC/CopD family protein [Acidimicrobiia bacterium]